MAILIRVQATPPSVLNVSKTTTATGPVENLGPQTALIVWLLVSAAGVFVCLRIYAKISKLTGLWWDDYVLILSWICAVAGASLNQAVIQLGIGKHFVDIDPQNVPAMLLIGRFAATAGILAVLWSKTSFAITLLRLTHGKLHAFIWLVIVTMNILMGLLAVFTWMQCKPNAAIAETQTDGVCLNPREFEIYGVFASTFSGSMDLLLAMLPWRLIWGMRMRKKEKIGIGIAMSMGVFAGVTAFFKSAKLQTIGMENFTYEGTALLIWGGAESATTIMAACIPMLRVFIRDASRQYAPGKSPASLRPHVVKFKGPFSATTRNASFDDTKVVPLKGYESIQTSFLWTRIPDQISRPTRAAVRPLGGIMRTREVDVSYHDRAVFD